MSESRDLPRHNKEISWLSFNERVLQEARDPRNPLGERLKFLGIFSSNLDEFFRVRVSNLKRLVLLKKPPSTRPEEDASIILDRVKDVYFQQRKVFEDICNDIFKEMEDQKVFILRENQLNSKQRDYIQDYFDREVRPNIFPIILDPHYKLPELRGESLYLAVELYRNTKKKEMIRYSFVEIPTNVLPRFQRLPASGDEQHFILLDEIVRFGLDSLFSIHGYKTTRAYNFKVTKDAFFDLDDDISLSYLEKMDKGLQRRKEGDIIRYSFDENMPESMVALFSSKIKLHKLDFVSPGGRYHHFKDFISLPKLAGLPCAVHFNPIPHPEINPGKKIISSLKKRDILLYFPYHSFHTIIDLLREASFDPSVESIKVTVYRVAENSSVINALINAKKNRKEVVVFLELQARFDEKNNIHWANILKEEGIKVIFGIKGLKVHSKLCLITCRKGKKVTRYACIGTGNLNEDTARLYTDTFLLTSHPEITEEVEGIFEFFRKNYQIKPFHHLLVSPFSFRQKIMDLIDREMELARTGHGGRMDLKMNSFADTELTNKLYEAAQAGVKIRIICRGRFYPIIGKEGLSDNIQAISIVDKYLEHARFFLFGNGGYTRCFIGSADWQLRNIDRRVEVTCPIYRHENIKTLQDIFEIQWNDNVKARILDPELKNHYRMPGEGEISHRSQDEVFEYLSAVEDSGQIS